MAGKYTEYRKKEYINKIKSWSIGLSLAAICIYCIVWFFNRFDYVAEVVNVENITIPVVDAEFVKYNIKENSGIVVQAKSKSGNFYTKSYMKFNYYNGGLSVSSVPQIEIGESVTLGPSWTQIKKPKENKISFLDKLKRIFGK